LKVFDGHDARMKSRSVLAIMAHPDDIEVYCAGTIIHLKQKGWNIHLATMTAGGCGSKVTSVQETERIRFAEAHNAAKLIGATYDCLGEKDLEVVYSVPLLRKTVELVRRYNPTVVITHPPSDYHIDHEGCSTAVRVACFSAGVQNFSTHTRKAAKPTAHVPALYYSDSPEGVDIFGKTNPVSFYVNINKTIQTKAKMLACHVSQRLWLKQHHKMDHFLISMKEWAAKRGKQCGVKYAETFRQHLGHGYPKENLIGETLGKLVIPNPY
jgi:N-acetylglucosamine malate deacetylase 1